MICQIGIRAGNKHEGHKENGDFFHENLKKLQGKKFVNQLEVKVMVGEKADIHDRFLITDNFVWLLGSSLNEFGSRGTMLVRLPEPKAVIETLESIYSRSEDFSDWYNKRVTNRKRQD